MVKVIKYETFILVKKKSCTKKYIANSIKICTVHLALKGLLEIILLHWLIHVYTQNILKIYDILYDEQSFSKLPTLSHY